MITHCPVCGLRLKIGENSQLFGCEERRNNNYTSSSFFHIGTINSKTTRIFRDVVSRSFEYRIFEEFGIIKYEVNDRRNLKPIYRLHPPLYNVNIYNDIKYLPNKQATEFVEDYMKSWELLL